MYFDHDQNFFESDSDIEDDDFNDLMVMIVFPRRQRNFRQRADHFTHWRDDEFFDRYRLSKTSVRFIINLIGDRICSRTDWNHAVSSEHKVLLTLRYYATGSMLVVCGDFIGVHKSTASRIVKLVSHEIALLRPLFVHFPNNEMEIKQVKQDFYNIAKFPLVIGALDCTHVKIRSPGGDNAEMYRNRKSFFSINVQTICDANLKIQDIVARWPGSSHDSTIFNNSAIRGKFERGEMQNCLLVADSGYAQRDFVMTLVGNPGSLIDPASGITAAAVDKYNESLIRTRNTVERSYGVWKRRFPILATGINVKRTSSQSIIVATAVLHNIACEFKEGIPRVTTAVESSIRITDFNNPGDAISRNAVQNSTRRKLLRYFANV
ncbi:unnamed protein product [Macrosiphum euphorbiae]|uniref:DDE Tnp4 domain-containing protein n=1 Tax=Macrosiphum euphorbiae TaxID=13131 RepID=A0AAV0XQ11_9HEMI|nr:unnamed protein product [Macrosiphum euphorbiae]CAI6370709.1 unnamed protein product [Macrosiphum euphorbiae]